MRVKDLHACGQVVELWWRKRRLTCPEPLCGTGSFTQQSEAIPARARLTGRLREAIATAVTGLTTTSTRVFQSRVYPLERGTDLPGLLVFSLAETSERRTAPAPGIMERVLRVQIVAVARALADLDDTLDGICKEVEMALAGLAKTITLTSTDIEMQGTSDRPVGQAAMTYEVVYLAAENAPDVAF